VETSPILNHLECCPKQPGVLAGPITLRSRGSNPAPAIFEMLEAEIGKSRLERIRENYLESRREYMGDMGLISLIKIH